MNLVDSCGWLEYLSDGKNSDFFAPAIQDRNNLLVPTICIYEVFKKVFTEMGEDKALQVAALMQKSGKPVDLDTDVAIAAASISATEKFPMADSIILATAHLQEAVIWTEDEHFKGLRKVKYIEK
jgi:PIN domain nuclease of toxin-antitoxin system